MDMRTGCSMVAVVLVLAACGGEKAADKPATVSRDEVAVIEPSITGFCAAKSYARAAESLGSDPMLDQRDLDDGSKNVDEVIALLRRDPEAQIEGDEKNRTVKDFAVDQVSKLRADDCDPELADRLQRVIDAG